MNRHVVHGAVLLAFAMALAACGASQPPPTNQDVTAAVRALLQQQHAAFGAAADAATAEVKVYDCSPAPDHRGFLCETAISTAPPASAAQRLIRMVRTANGWQATME